MDHDLSKLKTVPLREIIFSISFAEVLSPEDINEIVVHPLITDVFKKKSNTLNTNFTLDTDKLSAGWQAKTEIVGFMLVNIPDSSKVLRIKRGNLSLHKLNGYEPFNSLQEELFKYLRLIEERIGSLTINNINVRYVNSFDFENEVERESILLIKTSHPFGANGYSILNNVKLSYNDLNANVITSIKEDQTKKKLILDIIVNNKDILAIEHSNQVFDRIRILKNELFGTSITEKTYKFLCS